MVIASRASFWKQTLLGRGTSVRLMVQPLPASSSAYGPRLPLTGPGTAGVSSKVSIIHFDKAKKFEPSSQVCVSTVILVLKSIDFIFLQ